MHQLKRKAVRPTEGEAKRKSKRTRSSGARDVETATPKDHAQYTAYSRKAATVGNGLYVGVSRLVPSAPMLGLFADRVFAKGAPVVAYGGRVLPVDSIPEDSKTHTIHTRGGGVRSAYDGKAVADGLAARWAASEYSDDFRADTLSNDGAVSGGGGFMVNCPCVGQRHNLFTRYVKRDKDSLLPEAIFFVASREIAKDEELLLHYHWTDPAMLGSIGR